MKRPIYLLASMLVAAASLCAQEGVSPISVQVGMGFTKGVGHAGDDLNTGWNMGGGVGYNFNSHIGAMLNIRTQLLGTSVTVPGNLSVSGGHMMVFSSTFDPVFHLNQGGHVDVYITGGGGMYRRSFSPAQTFALRSDYSVIKPGWDAGVGFAVGTPWRGKLFAEARYEHIFDNNNFFTNLVPVTFGFRW